MITKCDERARLGGQANSVLEKLVNLTNAQLKVFQARIMQNSYAWIRELELTVGEKERTIGAVRQHIQEHGCATREYYNHSKGRAVARPTSIRLPDLRNVRCLSEQARKRLKVGGEHHCFSPHHEDSVGVTTLRVRCSPKIGGAKYQSTGITVETGWPADHWGSKLP